MAEGARTFEIAEIAERGGLTPRKVRYVLDQCVLPGGGGARRGRGVARRYLPFEAFGIIVAAQMLECGLKRALVRDCLEILCRERDGDIDTVPLNRAFEADEAARLEVGDWAYVRLSGSRRGPKGGFDTGWRPLGEAAPPDDYSPLLNVIVDVHQIRRRLGPP